MSTASLTVTPVASQFILSRLLERSNRRWSQTISGYLNELLWRRRRRKGSSGHIEHCLMSNLRLYGDTKMLSIFIYPWQGKLDNLLVGEKRRRLRQPTRRSYGEQSCSQKQLSVGLYEFVFWEELKKGEKEEGKDRVFYWTAAPERKGEFFGAGNLAYIFITIHASDYDVINKVCIFTKCWSSSS